MHHNFDLEFRAVTTGATFVEGGGRVRWGLPSGAFSVGARIGAIAGVGSSGPFAGMYPGALVSFGSPTVQGTLGLDVWLLSTDRYDSATHSKSQTVLRASAGVELAVSDSTWLYLRVLWFARTHRAFADGSPTLVLGVSW